MASRMACAQHPMNRPSHGPPQGIVTYYMHRTGSQYPRRRSMSFAICILKLGKSTAGTLGHIDTRVRESGGVFFTKNRRFENHLTIS